MTTHSVENHRRPGIGNPPSGRHPAALTDHAGAGTARRRRQPRHWTPGALGVRSRGPKLDVLVGADLDGGSIRLVIRGTVTAQNLSAVYVLVKRATTAADGLTIIVDFRHANVGAGPLKNILSASKEGRLPSSVAPSDTPCRLLVVEPQAW